MEKMVPVGISAHHIHLSKADFNALFPNQEDLTHFKDLSQPGQYAAVEKLDVVSLDPKGKTIAGVRILGPLRPESQVELMRSECTKCKINGRFAPNYILLGVGVAHQQFFISNFTFSKRNIFFKVHPCLFDYRN